MFKLRINKIINQPGENITIQFEPVDEALPQLSGRTVSITDFSGENTKKLEDHILSIVRPMWMSPCLLRLSG